MQQFLSRADFAKRIGVLTGTLSRYNLPEPDAMIGSARGWLPETIDAWNAARPGRTRRQAATPADAETSVRARDLSEGMRIIAEGEIHVIDLVIDDVNDMYVHTENGIVFYFTPKTLVPLAPAA